MKITDAGSLDDAGLAAALVRLAGAEREATVALIVHLAEFDRRQLYRGAGMHSLFQYCVEVLRLSEDAASNRIATARMARRHPVVVERLAAGTLSPTTVRLVAAHATAENGRELIDAAVGKTKREVELLLARLFPQKDVPPSIRPIGPPPLAAPVPSPALALDGPPEGAAVGRVVEAATVLSSTPAAPAAPAVPAAPAAPAAPAPVPDRFQIRFTARADTVEKLKMVQDLLAHAVPSGDIGEVVDRALTALAEQLLRTRFAVTASPRKSADAASTAEKPAAVRRAVYLRDRGRCTFVSEDGRRCDSRRYLQFDHVTARAVGGGFTVDNVRLRCGPHNRLEAERLYATPPRARDAGGARVVLVGTPPFIRPGTDESRRGRSAGAAT